MVAWIHDGYVTACVRSGWPPMSALHSLAGDSPTGSGREARIESRGLISGSGTYQQ
jgi:hypothetical protein